MDEEDAEKKSRDNRRENMLERMLMPLMPLTPGLQQEVEKK